MDAFVAMPHTRGGDAAEEHAPLLMSTSATEEAVPVTSLAELNALAAKIYGFDADMTAAVLAGVDGDVAKCADMLETVALEQKTRQLQRENLEAARRMGAMMKAPPLSGCASRSADLVRMSSAEQRHKRLATEQEVATVCQETAVVEQELAETERQIANAEEAEEARQCGLADKALPAGTRVQVEGLGLGSYERWSQSWLGANDHFIRFPSGVEKVELKKLGPQAWTVVPAQTERQIAIAELQVAEEQSDDPFVQKKLAIQEKIAETKVVRQTPPNHSAPIICG
jgi:hypothetical protein